MLFSEFVDNVGCRENAYNFKVYKDIEVMYMNGDISKEDVYEYGRKLINDDIKECRFHPLPWLVVCDVPSHASSYVAAAFMLKEAAETYVKQFRPFGSYRVMYKSDLDTEYTVIEDKYACD